METDVQIKFHIRGSDYPVVYILFCNFRPTSNAGSLLILLYLLGSNDRRVATD